MAKGQPLSPVWADIVRGGGTSAVQGLQRHLHVVHAGIHRPFRQIHWPRKVHLHVGPHVRRTTNPSRALGGANPHYDSSETGNFQLCAALYAFCNVKAIFLVGDGFNEETVALPFVFNLGAFWKRSPRRKASWGDSENGFFNYMTTFYDCDVVHVGMKSGGMWTRWDCGDRKWSSWIP